MALIDWGEVYDYSSVTDATNTSTLVDGGGTWNFSVGSVSSSINTGGIYGNFIRTNPGIFSAITRRTFPTTITGANGFYFGGRFRLNVTLGNTNAGDANIYFLDASNAELFHIDLQMNRLLRVLRNTTVLAAPVVPSMVNSTTMWHYIEVSGIISATVGTLVVKWNGDTIVNLTGINNTNTGGTTLAAFHFGSNVNNSLDLDSFYICDGTGSAPFNGSLGELRIYRNMPTQAGATLQFTPISGTNADNVDNTPIVGTAYNYASAAGSQDLFPFTTPSGATVYLVRLRSMLANADGGTRTVANIIQSGTTVAQGTALGPISYAVSFPTTAIALVVDTYTTDPNTGSQWTGAALAAAKFGYRIVS